LVFKDFSLILFSTGNDLSVTSSMKFVRWHLCTWFTSWITEWR